MKKLFLAIFGIAILFPFSNAKAEIEVVEGKPNRTYTVVSPISSDKKSAESAFADLKAKALKLKADAVIDYSCTAQQSTRMGLYKVRASAICQGVAVKWQGSSVSVDGK